MCRWLTVLFVLALLLPTVGHAESWSWGCGFIDNLTPLRPNNFLIERGNVGCYRFINTDTTSTSDLIVVRSESALWCFDPDNTGTATDTSRVQIHRCVTGIAGGTGSVNTCLSIGELDGTEGDAATQNACVRTGPGVYFIRVSAACEQTSTDYCEVSVKGESLTD